MNKKILFLSLLIGVSNVYTMEKTHLEKEPTNNPIENLDSVKTLFLTKYCEKSTEFYTLTTQIENPEGCLDRKTKIQNITLLLDRYADTIERLQKVQKGELEILQQKANLDQDLKK